jgi:hypothetical protein
MKIEFSCRFDNSKEGTFLAILSASWVDPAVVFRLMNVADYRLPTLGHMAPN